MPWQVVAEGRTFGELRAKVANREFGKGTRLRLEMTGPPGLGPAFDLAPNWVFPAPDGTDVVDIWGEGASKGVVELEADPVWLVALLSFVKAHWVGLLIGVGAGFVLGLVVTQLRLLADLPKAALGIGIILVVLLVLSALKPKGRSP